jgi:hypothetical protein
LGIKLENLVHKRHVCITAPLGLADDLSVAAAVCLFLITHRNGWKVDQI